MAEHAKEYAQLIFDRYGLPQSEQQFKTLLESAFVRGETQGIQTGQRVACQTIDRVLEVL